MSMQETPSALQKRGIKSIEDNAKEGEYPDCGNAIFQFFGEELMQEFATKGEELTS